MSFYKAKGFCFLWDLLHKIYLKLSSCVHLKFKAHFQSYLKPVSCKRSFHAKHTFLTTKTKLFSHKNTHAQHTFAGGKLDVATLLLAKAGASVAAPLRRSSPTQPNSNVPPAATLPNSRRVADEFCNLRWCFYTV